MTSIPDAGGGRKPSPLHSTSDAPHLDYLTADDARSRGIRPSLLPPPIYTALDGSDCCAMDDIDAYIGGAQS